jgi:hypothetical protein
MLACAPILPPKPQEAPGQTTSIGGVNPGFSGRF